MLIPCSPAEVTAEWLAAVLSSPGHPVTVDSVALAPVGTGQTGATYRIVARYPKDQADLPDSFVVKLPAQDEQVRQRVALSYRSEHAFYTGVADTVEVPLPRCYHCSLIWRRPSRAIRSAAATRPRRAWRYPLLPACTVRAGATRPG